MEERAAQLSINQEPAENISWSAKETALKDYTPVQNIELTGSQED